ncbi:MAG: tripartite tricarboxylate transporter substrate-binding protein [Verrucomicrobia bacterium]|nr:tripartite tricarboxylate transporter substrate-binding protein [Verrucomicrobiota bacterium]
MTQVQRNVIKHSLICGLILLAIFQFLKIGSYRGDEYPRKPIRVVVPFAPGGGSDTFVRIVQKAINDYELMSQPLVVVNKPGGGTSIGSSYVKDARADGYTVLCLHEALMVAKSTGQSPNGPDDYDVAAATGEFGEVVLVSEASPYQSLGALMEAAKEYPETLKFGLNLNTPSHFSAIMLENTLPGARFRFVATGGGAHRLAGVMGGHLDVIILSVGEYVRFQQNGLKAIAYLGEERIATIPDVPTGEELGFPVYSANLHYWWFPKGTDSEIVDYFAGVMGKVMETDYVQQRTGELQILPRIIVGYELHQRIESQMKVFDQIKPESRVELPDFTLWTLGSVAVFSVIVFGRRLVATGSPAAKESKQGLRYDFAFGTLAMTVVYVLLMGLGLLSFVWSTIVFICASGLFLTRFDKRKWVSILEVALLMSFGLHYIFTQLFTIDLP